MSEGGIGTSESQALLDIDGLRVSFGSDGETVVAVNDVTLRMQAGRTLGLVGESGSGKSVTSLSIMRLLPKAVLENSLGGISFLGRDLPTLSPAQMRQIRGRDIGMIFQSPDSSLNPVYRVGNQVIEAIRIHERVPYAEARRRAIDLFTEVGIPEPERRIDSYPHELSGGQKQRVMIAMALCCSPRLLIADEPTTALDVTIQAQILDLIRRLRDERGMAVLFVTHDLGVVAEIADEVAVMFRGDVVEYAPTEQLFTNPQHPYTKGLLRCRPRLDSTGARLPTLSDFMGIEVGDDGKQLIVEHTMDSSSPAPDAQRKLLSPRSELERIGHGASYVEREGDVHLVAEEQRPLLRVEGLQVRFPVRRGLFGRAKDYVRAVDGVTFNVYRGQTLGLVGESGCGKTTTGRAILRLLPIASGRVEFDGVDLASLDRGSLRALRRRIQLVAQNPAAALNPRMNIEDLLTEPMIVHRLDYGPAERRKRAVQLLEEVGLTARHLTRYPHEFSGGQQQRICIARALASEPDFLVCDESVSALDVSVQAQVLNLLKELQETRGLTYLFISHDLSVVKFMSDMMGVMRAGKLVEFGPADAVYTHPADPYTRQLINAIPDDSIENIRARRAARDRARLDREQEAAAS